MLYWYLGNWPLTIRPLFHDDSYLVCKATRTIFAGRVIIVLLCFGFSLQIS
jgi:hypothetical protein